MNWEDQGRQEHGEFGHGTAPPKLKNKSVSVDMFDAAEVAKRADAVSSGVIGALPKKLRVQAAAQFGSSGERHANVTRSRMVDLMTAWSGASDLDPDSFASRFFDKPATDPLVIHLRTVGIGLDSAKTHRELADVSEKFCRGDTNYRHRSLANFSTCSAEAGHSTDDTSGSSNALDNHFEAGKAARCSIYIF